MVNCCNAQRSTKIKQLLKEVPISFYHRALALISALSLLGCYHATIETGLTPSGEVIHKSFASSWIYGLVPPSTVSTATKCPNGVAKVETQHSFVNGLVAGITLGIYTPINIKVTCDAGDSAMLPSDGPDIVLDGGATEEEILQAFSRVADIAVAANRPTFIKY
ncbi:MAG: Bor family protein [Ignavibacteria bacterium]|nr:Bor family protein [Ignavibacteria bacterium]